MSHTPPPSPHKECDIYDESQRHHSTMDFGSSSLSEIPFIDNKNLRILYLQENNISEIPEDFFPSLPNLMWLDLRDNQISEIPKTIQGHRGLTHLLLQNNKLLEVPNELGTVRNLKVLQLNGNPLTYPPKSIVKRGVHAILTFLEENYLDQETSSKVSKDDLDQVSNNTLPESDSLSYNSVIDNDLKKCAEALAIHVKEREFLDSDEEYYEKFADKCPKLAISRSKPPPPHSQSYRYVPKPRAPGKTEYTEKIKRAYLKDQAMKRHQERLAIRDRIIQERKNLDLLKKWRGQYRELQYMRRPGKFEQSYPFDTSAEYMTVLSREDIEKDLPDKYRKSLVRRCRPSVPRKGSSDVQLAMKIKKMFENLEEIDLNRGAMTPRSEQKALLGEIQKISEIKQKLMELSTKNMHTEIEPPRYPE